MSKTRRTKKDEDVGKWFVAMRWMGMKSLPIGDRMEDESEVLGYYNTRQEASEAIDRWTVEVAENKRTAMQQVKDLLAPFGLVIEELGKHRFRGALRFTPCEPTTLHPALQGSYNSLYTQHLRLVSVKPKEQLIIYIEAPDDFIYRYQLIGCIDTSAVTDALKEIHNKLTENT